MKRWMTQNLAGKWIFLGLRLALGTVFIISSVAKLQYPTEFRDAVANYGLLPNSLAHFYGTVLPWTELLIGCCLVLGIFTLFASALTVPLVISFVVANSVAIARSVDAPCDCLGKLLTLSHPLALLFDFAMLLVAGALVIGRDRIGFAGLGWVLSRLPIQIGRPRRFVFQAAVLILAMVIAVSIWGTARSRIYGRIEPALQEGKPVVLLFTSSDSEDFASHSVIVAHIEQQYAASIYCEAVDCVEDKPACTDFKVREFPTTLLLEPNSGGSGFRIYSRFVGPTDEAEIRNAIDELLSG